MDKLHTTHQSDTLSKRRVGYRPILLGYNVRVWFFGVCGIGVNKIYAKSKIFLNDYMITFTVMMPIYSAFRVIACKFSYYNFSNWDVI